MITHRERIQALLKGEIVDRPPVALWRHFPVDDQTPGGLAAATIQFQQTYDFDLVKVTPASSFCLKDWGVEDAWRGNPEGTREYTKRPIQEPRDWETLQVLTPQSSRLAAQLECLREIRAALPPETPLLQTVFSPLAQARNLAGAEILLSHLRLYPDAVLKGLEIIAGTTRRFVEAVMATGVDGVFYAIQHAQAQLMSREEYQTFGLPFDLQSLQPSEAGWCNMLHLHGHNVYFETASNLPAQIVNWHDRESSPSLSEARDLFRGSLCGGLRQDTLVYSTASEVETEGLDAIRQMDGRRLLLSTGCVVPVIAPQGNIRAARQIVEPKQ
ncbi:MAG TPA: uroporphyrinogen decarboxylase family protein [Anaerolineales bacterium]